MDDLDRRSFLALWFQALLMAIFPSLRPQPQVAAVLAEQIVQRQLFKGGEFKLSIAIKGFEVDEDWLEVLKADPELRDALVAECGINFPD